LDWLFHFPTLDNLTDLVDLPEISNIGHKHRED